MVTVGGSATTDGGRGALEALGAHFTSRTADLRALRRTLRGVKLSLACDVRIPMCGPDGAARTFAPQKGASPDEVGRLERRLVAWARLARSTAGRDPAAEPMAGAGGGLAGGLWAFAGAALRPGAALVLDTIGFDAAMRGVVRGRDRRGVDGPPDPARQGRVRGRHPLPPGRRALLCACRAWTGWMRSRTAS